MSPRAQLIRRIMLALDSLDGNPMDHDLLVDAAGLRFQPRPTRAEVEDAIKEAEQLKYIEGTTVELEGVKWLLTSRGKIKAQGWK